MRIGYKRCGLFVGIACVAVGLASVGAMDAAPPKESNLITITLAGQSMIRSDLQTTAPATVPVIQALLKGDVVFTNLESVVAEKGETVQEGRGFLTPPEALDALKTLGFNLLAMSGNHAFDMGAKGIQNTIREAESRGMIHAGTGLNLAEAAAPRYLNTPQGKIALVASASGLLKPDASATK
jgi:poly-gamma-glutamate capsule biosynthesis protein CapA/YwtB (metallophosphatase superfamily)